MRCGRTTTATNRRWTNCLSAWKCAPPDHIAVKYYKDYRSGSAKTLKSIQITLAARLEKFNLSSVAALTATDELDLASLGEKRRWRCSR